MSWDRRFAEEGYLFGTAPARFLTRHASLLSPGSDILVVADGEGRNSVWLAEQGHRVTAWDASRKAVEKARNLAADRGVEVSYSVQDAASYRWPDAEFDAVVGIFIQFAAQTLRDAIFAGMIQATRPGGLVMLHGYSTEQLHFGTGGPPDPERLYTEILLRERFAGTDIVHLTSYDAEISEGRAHVGRSALIDLVARVPVETRTSRAECVSPP